MRGAGRIGMRGVRGTTQLGETKIEHFHDAVRCQLDVRGLEIAVDDAAIVRGFERFGHLARDGEDFVDRHGR